MTPQQENAPTEIVVIDMIASVESSKFIAVKKNMDETDYACISYRRGEVTEQIVHTPDYNAHVTSFDLDDLMIVCQQILNDASGGGCRDDRVDPSSAYSSSPLRYLWVAAISMDPRDALHKKTKIHRMSEIFTNAQVIIAVPDLIRSYLARNPAIARCMDTIASYRRKVFRHVAQQCWRTEDEEEAALREEGGAEDEETTKNSEEAKQGLAEKTYVCNCTNDLDEQETLAYSGAVQYIHYLVDDWSARVWVISEYNIGRRTKMKLMFVSMCDPPSPHGPHRLINMFDPRAPTLFDNQLQNRSFLDLMLHSRATYNEDRFYAILPLFPRYKRMANEDTISSWGITDSISVRLRLYQMVSFEEKLVLLLCGVRPSVRSHVILPSFAAFYQLGDFEWAMTQSKATALLTSVDLVTPTTTGEKSKPYLVVTVPWSRTLTNKAAIQHDLNVAQDALTLLGLNELLDQLVTVFVPITIHNEQMQHNLGIKLLGHRKRNQWIMLHRMVDLVDTPQTLDATDGTSVTNPVLWSDKVVEKQQVFYIY